AAEQRPQRIDRGKKIAPGVLLHHREQEVAARVPGQPTPALEHREPGQQDGAGLAFVARQRQRALQHVAGRQDAELVPQLARRSAAVEHRDDSVQIDPGVVLQAAEQTGQAGASAEAADLEHPQLHRVILRGPAAGQVLLRAGSTGRHKYNCGMPLTLTPTARKAFDRMAVDLRRVFGDRFVALVASTGHSGVAFASSILPGDLEALGPLTSSWERDALDPPLLLTPREFRRSLDTFPLEYRALLARHVVIDGTPPFDDAVVDRQQLRHACEVQAKSHLIHLRQGWVQAGSDKGSLSELLVRSAAPLRALLANISDLVDDAGPSDPVGGAEQAGIDTDLTRAILALEDDESGAPALTDRLGDYVVLAERLWAFVDTWTSR